MMDKKFDCVEMKRKGAEKVQKEIKGLTLEQELEYWERSTQELKKQQNEFKHPSKKLQSAASHLSP